MKSEEVRVGCVRRPTVKVEVPSCPNHFTCRHHKTVEDMKQELAMISAVSKPFHPVLLWFIASCFFLFIALFLLWLMQELEPRIQTASDLVKTQLAENDKGVSKPYSVLNFHSVYHLRGECTSFM